MSVSWWSPFLLFVGTRLKRLFSVRVPLPQSPAGWLMATLSTLGVAGLGYLGGAAVMYYELPSCDFLNKSFAGAIAWYERGRSTLPSHSGAPSSAPLAKVTVDQADKTYDGFTLYTGTDSARATLLDMRGNVVHRWELPFRQAWPKAPHVNDPLPDDHIHWFHCHLYANGDLLAIYHADGDTPYGYGLVKVDKDSKLLWSYANHVHHSLDVGEDGTIYTLTQKIIAEPPAGLEFLSMPCLTDSLVVLAADGRELETIPLLEAFVPSLYAPMLDSIPKHLTLRYPGGDPAPSRSQRRAFRRDLLHTNSAKILSRALAPKFPAFQSGQVLLSLRNLDALVVLDLPTRRVVWAAQGIWQTQHDADFLDNGHLLLYDNGGSPRGARILEYDPLTQAIPWLYAGEKKRRFQARFRGATQRLPNGNTLIVDPDDCWLFEVTPDKELVWESVLSPAVSQSVSSSVQAINHARRYRADELTFLKGVARPRP
jgi:hypothetical protein